MGQPTNVQLQRNRPLGNLRWSDIDMRTRMVSFPHTKNGEMRSIPMTETFYKLLQSLPRPLDQKALILPALM